MKSKINFLILAATILLAACGGKPAPAAATEAPVELSMDCPPPASFVLAPDNFVNLLDQTTGDPVGRIILSENLLTIDTIDGQHIEKTNPNGGYEIVTVIVDQEGDALIVLVINKTIFACDGKLYHRPQDLSPPPSGEIG